MSYGTITRSMSELSSLAKLWEPARRFVRAQDTSIPDASLDPAEYQMRCLLHHVKVPTAYPACTDQSVIDAYDIFLFTSHRDMVLSLLIVGNTITETALKSGLTEDQIKSFSYFFCNDEFRALPPAAKTAVLCNPNGFYKSAELLFAVNNPKEVVDIHFNIRTADVKACALAWREHEFQALHYLAMKEVHYVKPGQKSFKPVIETLAIANEALRDYTGGEKSGTVDQVMKDIAELQGKRTVVEVKSPEDLNLSPISDEIPPDNVEPKGGE